MSHTPEIQPALTPEEWAGPSAAGEPGIDRDGEWLHLYPHMDLVVVGQASTGELHALAALCLHGQPFGFTGDHAAALREAAYKLSGLPDGDACDAVAALIEALLPPDERPAPFVRYSDEAGEP